MPPGRLPDSSVGSEPVAVVGMGCRFPGGCDTPARYWSFLQSGGCAIAEVPRDRWDIEGYYDPDPRAPGKMYSRHGAFLAQRPDGFDASFFGISPHEAWPIDPSHRLLLEVAWEALEHAGIPPRSLAGSKTGVFAGVADTEYLLEQFRVGTTRDLTAYHGMVSAAFGAGRISYLLGLEGPAASVDTACSSSLVASLMAVDSLRAGQCDLALAGGTHLMLTPMATAVLCRMTALSLTGRSRVFDADADGFVRGEGAGMVILKRLSDALADGDRIYATILGGVTNHDGRSTSLSTPRGEAQEAAIRDALAATGLGIDDIDYVEAHGTGTPVGDPIEATAIGNVLAAGRNGEAPLLIGSGKTNFGHLEAASGVAALIKVALSLHHEAIPAHINFSRPNPAIDWARYRMQVPLSRTPWSRRDRTRVAGINSFGLSGTNAHLIVSEAPEPEPRTSARSGRSYLLPLSARSPEALVELADAWTGTLSQEGAPELRDLMLTAGAGRSHDRRRIAVTGSSPDELIGQLASRRDEPSSAPAADDEPLAFLFTGQGAQYAGMGRGLYEASPVFRSSLDACAAALGDHMDRPLLSVLFEADHASLIDRTEYTQPALVAVQLALLDVWSSWGVTPTHVLGHSLGEYAAAVAAGVLSRDDALRLVARRGALMLERTEPGAMSVVFADEEAVRDVVRSVEGVSIAAVNGPTNTVVSGGFAEMTALRERLDALELGHQALEVSHAFHSALMDPMLDPFEEVVRGASLAEPSCHLVSNVSGSLEDGALFTDPTYWRRHVREPVRFADSIVALQEAGVRTMLEIGPHPTLLGMAGLNITKPGVSLVPSLRRGQDDEHQLLRAAGELYELGRSLDWSAVVSDDGARTTVAPTYPFQRRSHWFPTEGSSVEAQVGAVPVRPVDASDHPLLGTRLRVPGLGGVTFQSFLEPSAPRYLGSYRIRSSHFVPLAAQLEMVAAGARLGLRWDTAELREVVVDHPFGAPKGEGRICQVSFTDPEDGVSRFRVVSMARIGSGTPRWITHLSGTVARGTDERGPTDVPAGPVTPGAASELYDRLKADGLRLGSFFTPIQELHATGAEVVARVALAESLHHEAPRYGIHPALLQAAFQLAPVFDPDGSGDDGSFVPVGISGARIGPRAGETAWIRARRTESDADGLVLDVECLSETGEAVAHFSGVRHQRVRLATLSRVVSEDEWSLGVYWHEAPLGSVPLDARGSWLVLHAGQEAAPGIAEALAAGGGVVHSLRITDAPGGDADSLERGRADWAADALDRATSDGSGRLRGVVWVAGIDEVREADGSVMLDAAVELAGDMTEFIRTLGARDVLDGGLLILTAGVADPQTSGGERRTGGAALWGLLPVLQSEYMGVPTRILDLDPGTPSEWVAEVLAELGSQDDERRVTRRAGTRSVARLERFRDTGPVRDRVVRDDRAYFVTGGLGWIGRAVAGWLCDQGAGTVVLNARRAPNEDTAAWITELSGRSETRLEVVLGDVSSEADMVRIGEDLDGLDMPLGGIIHLAGALDPRLLRDLSRDDLRRLMAPKVAGTWHLHDLSLGRPVELFALFGSIGSLMGRATQAAYAAANAYLPAFARYRAEAGLPVSCFEWGLWGGGGMIGDVTDRDMEAFQTAGMSPLDPSRAVDVMGDHLREQTRRVVVASTDWGRVSETLAGLAVEPFLSELIVPVEVESDNDSSSALARLGELEALPMESRQARIEELVLDQVAEVLGVGASELARDVDLRMSGLDSLMALDLRHRVEAHLGLLVPTPGPMGTLTAERLASVLAEQVPEALARTDEEEAGGGDGWTEGEI